MNLAIDFDKTWTADPELWRHFVMQATLRGHSVVMVTGRKAWSDDMERAGLPRVMPIVYAGNEWKERAARAAGHKIDVWIDDMPGVIQPPAMAVDNL